MSKKNFVQFLSECLLNLLQGELKDRRKVDVVNIEEKDQKSHEKEYPCIKRTILGSPKGLQLVSLITPFVIKRMT